MRRRSDSDPNEHGRLSSSLAIYVLQFSELSTLTEICVSTYQLFYLKNNNFLDSTYLT